MFLHMTVLPGNVVCCICAVAFLQLPPPLTLIDDVTDLFLFLFFCLFFLIYKTSMNQNFMMERVIIHLVVVHGGNASGVAAVLRVDTGKIVNNCFDWNQF